MTRRLTPEREADARRLVDNAAAVGPAIARALLREIDALRAAMRQFVAHADGMNDAGSRAAGDSLDAIAPGVGEYLEAQREALGIWADEFRELLPKEDP